MVMDLLLGSMIGFGFVLHDDLSKQTQILADMSNSQLFAIQNSQLAKTAIPGELVLKRTYYQQNLIEKASEALRNQDYELALSFSDRLLKLEQKDPLYYAFRGDCYARLGRITEAVESYDNALDMNEKVNSLPATLEDALTIAIEELEKVQANIIHGGQKPTIEELIKLLDDAKQNTSKLSLRYFYNQANMEVSSESGANKLLQELNAKQASNKLDRLKLYVKCLVLHRMYIPNKNGIDVVFKDVRSTIDKWLQLSFKSTIGYIDAEICEVPPKYRLFLEKEGFKSSNEGVFQRNCNDLNLIQVAEMAEKILITLAENEQYPVIALFFF